MCFSCVFRVFFVFFSCVFLVWCAAKLFTTMECKGGH
nr:MAG TPA: hypothetical protein [Caudoviricetes sp.]